MPIDAGQQQPPPLLRQIKIEPEPDNKNLLSPISSSSSLSNNYFIESPPIIDTSTPESLERDFNAWMKGELKGRKNCFTTLEPVSMYLSPLKGELVNNTTTQTCLLPSLNDRYSPPHYYTTLQPLLPLSNEERRFSLPSLSFKTNQTSDICCFALPSAGQSPSSSTHSSSSEGSPQIQRLNECEQLMPLSGLSTNTCEPSIDAINVGQIDSSASRSSGVNQLGRTYSPGLPLSMSERQQIVDLHKSGWKICDISKCLCITHSCVSKILQRYRTTGSVRPKDAKEGRQESPLVAAIRDYRTRLGIVRQSEIREQLIRDGLCRRENAPSRSSINHILRTKLNNNVVDSHRQNNKNK
ncbi:unnamed protein product [Meloidogyne enterolobii]|uniref:Uncharacterized protein n=1 Tax=Meloidogyne enterolobii TaxID=390850 RepID=A0ACB0Y6P2_MELEN